VAIGLEPPQRGLLELEGLALRLAGSAGLHEVLVPARKLCLAVFETNSSEEKLALR
jgi:hypothetical protein